MITHAILVLQQVFTVNKHSPGKLEAHVQHYCILCHTDHVSQLSEKHRKHLTSRKWQMNNIHLGCWFFEQFQITYLTFDRFSQCWEKTASKFDYYLFPKIKTNCTHNRYSRIYLFLCPGHTNILNFQPVGLNAWTIYKCPMA